MPAIVAGQRSPSPSPSGTLQLPLSHHSFATPLHSMASAMAACGMALTARPAGGRPNSRTTAARAGLRRLAVQAVAAPEAPSSTSSAGLEGARQQLEAAVAAAPAAPAGTTAGQQAEGEAAPSKTGRVVLESEEELRSTWEHRAWVGGATALMAATLAQGLAQVDDLPSAAAAGAAALAAYYLADVGTAFYHW